MTGDIDHAALGRQIFAEIDGHDFREGKLDMAEFGHAVVAIFGQFGWKPPPLTGDALPSRVCRTCGAEAYFGDYCSQHGLAEGLVCAVEGCDRQVVIGNPYCLGHVHRM